MKYIKIKKSVMNQHHKYCYRHISFNNRKFQFTKRITIYIGDYDLRNYRIIFSRYMNDNVYISWV